MTSGVAWRLAEPRAYSVPMAHAAIRPAFRVVQGSIATEGGRPAGRGDLPAAVCLVAPVGNAPIDPDFDPRIASELPFLRRAARRWHRDKANADDLVQDTVVQALANARQWQPDSNLRGWLFTIMRNRFLANVAKSKRSGLLLDTIGAAEGSPSLGSSEARLVMRDLERALARLPERQQTAVRLIGIGGKSYEEAARLMEMSVAAVRCHLARGRERLRLMLEGRAEPPLPGAQPQWLTLAPKLAPRFAETRRSRVAEPV